MNALYFTSLLHLIKEFLVRETSKGWKLLENGKKCNLKSSNNYFCSLWLESSYPAVSLFQGALTLLYSLCLYCKCNILFQLLFSTESNEMLLFLVRLFARVNDDFIEQISILKVVLLMHLQLISVEWSNEKKFHPTTRQAKPDIQLFSLESIIIW